jgi:hypothetical protein
VFHEPKLPDKSPQSATVGAENARVGDFPRNLVQAPARPRFGRAKAVTVWTVTIAACLMLTSANAAPKAPRSGSSIAGVDAIGAPPAGPSWAPAPVSAGGLSSVATAGDGEYALHTAGGKVTFLPGVNLGSTTPGHQPGELSITGDQYKSWFAAMGWLGLRVVRVYTIHPPAFYQQLAAYDFAHPQRPLYLMQGVYPPDESYVRKGDLYDKGVTTAFQQELHDAADAVSGDLTRAVQAGRASGTWTADVTPWLLGWIVGVELDPSAISASDRKNAPAPVFRGRYFGSTGDASPTERWLAARMDELAGFEAGRRLSQPIAFVNWPTTDPLRHPSEPLAQEDLLQLDANHVRATAAWPAGTFASYHAYPYYPDFQRHEALGPDPYAGYLAALREHHGDMPTLVTEFGVPSSIGSAHNSPLGRSQGEHSEQQAMAIDAELLKVIHDQGLAGGFLFEWADEWFKFTWNTISHQDPERRQLWHDPLTNEQNFGLVAMDAAGSPDEVPAYLVDDETAWPARRVTASVDESYVYLRVLLGRAPPHAVTLSFDVLPALTGPPPPGSGDRWGDVAFTLDLVAHTGQAYIRQQMDPLPLDYRVPLSARGPAPAGWRRFELIVNRDLTIPATGEKLPLELQNAGALRYGSPEDDSRSLWQVQGQDDVTVRVPWGMLGYADPSAHKVGVPVPSAAGVATLSTQISPGVGVDVSAAGTDQQTGEVTWVNWNRPYWTERLKAGASAFRDAVLALS